MQAYENKTLHMLYKTIEDEPLCLWESESESVCVLWIIITKDMILPFSNYNVQICNFL
jgi:hypothetical protein